MKSMTSNSMIDKKEKRTCKGIASNVDLPHNYMIFLESFMVSSCLLKIWHLDGMTFYQSMYSYTITP
jgi:hypothetical protein